MRMIIAGSREFTDYEQLLVLITPFKSLITTVISGGAKGADALGERYAKDHDIPVEIYPADWETHGKSAGYIRNSEMADVADGLIAFNQGGTKGTNNMISIALKRNKMVVVFNIPEVVTYTPYSPDPY